MPQAGPSQQFAFQAEVRELLNILAHSLYPHKEVAIRELVANASDALDRMRHIMLTDDDVDIDEPLEIVIERDPKARTIAICDNGIGMTREELVKNLGTIARSGSVEFLRQLARDQRKGLRLIGQFGVGFYSAFMIAKKVTVYSRSYREQQGWLWESEGTGTFRVAPLAEPIARGTRVVLELKPEFCELVEAWRLAEVLERYAAFVRWPIKLDGEVINRQRAIWAEPPHELSEEDYVRFYQFLVRSEEEQPLWYVHLAVDVPFQFYALVYCPPTNLELLGYGPLDHGMHLCVRRILVDPNCRELVPEYLRFLRGVVDSEDLSLNLSRESPQDRRIFQTIRAMIVRHVLERLEQLAKYGPDTYLQFYRQFGRMLKEGAHIDIVHRPRLLRLLRFLSTYSDDPQQPVSLDDYVSRMKPGQEQIYYIAGTDLNTLRASPHLEVFRAKQLEVLYLLDPLDEFVFAAAREYRGKKFVAVDSAEVELPEQEATSNKVGQTDIPPKEDQPEQLPKLLELFKNLLAGKVEDVRVTDKLVDSPCRLVRSMGSTSAQMEHFTRGSQQGFVPTKPILELNPRAELVRLLCELVGQQQFDCVKLCAEQLLANALLQEGVLHDRQAFIDRTTKLMLAACKGALKK